MSKVAVDKFDHIKFEAERLVEQAVMKTPESKKAVRETIKLLRTQEAKVQKIIRKKNK